jgi:hypothetical protein
MKKTDIAMIILIAGVGILVAYFIAVNIPFLKIPEQGVEVQTVDSIGSEISEPSKSVFNAEAINPTVEIVVGGNGAQ